MTPIATIIAVPYFIVCGVCIFIGLDLRKWRSWLYGLYGFISGFMIGLSVGGITKVV